MSDYDGSIDDTAVLGRNATNEDEKKEVLIKALSYNWADKIVAKTERIDSDSWHGWLMWENKGS